MSMALCAAWAAAVCRVKIKTAELQNNSALPDDDCPLRCESVAPLKEKCRRPQAPALLVRPPFAAKIIRQSLQQIASGNNSNLRIVKRLVGEPSGLPFFATQRGR